MQYDRAVQGSWFKADEAKDGQKVKIVSECVKQESKFKNKDGETKTENIVKVRVQGTDEAVNMRLNWTTIYGLIDAFGNESKSWMGQVLTIKTLEAMVGDTMRTIVYLIPEGFELAKNAEKKMEIRKVDGYPKAEDEGIDGDVPF